jgi:DNA adenine methylase
MDDDAHKELASVLRECRGKVAISGYRCDLMEKMYSRWTRVDADQKMCHSIKKPRREAVWMNY